MGVLKVVLGVVRGASTLSVVALDRMAAEAPRPQRAPRRLARPQQSDSSFLAFYPSQSESAALLDAYVVRAPEAEP